ncbi:MAG: hypothetical protein WCO56_23215 [Verrucomicrobiota bacterium]
MQTTENQDSVGSAASSGTTRNGWPGFLFRLLILGIVVAALVRVYLVAQWHLASPFDLVYESPNRMTIQTITEGKNIYDAALYNAPPFWITLYTPLYHYLVSWLPFDGPNRFYSGRVLSMSFMILAAAFLFVASRRQNRLFPLLAFGVFFLMHPVMSNTVFLKNDSAALFFSVAALVCATKIPRPALAVCTASLCAMLAAACKQSYLAAAAACLVYFWMTSHRQGLLYLAALAALTLIGGVLAQIWWGSGFWFCVFKAARNPLEWDTFATNWMLMLKQPVFVCLLIGWVIWLGVLLWKHGSRTLANPWLLYFLLSSLALLGFVGKAGASTNYFIEPVLAGLLWLVASADQLAGDILRERGFKYATLLLALGTAGEMWSAKPPAYAFTTPSHTEFLTAFHEDMRKEVAALVKGKPAPIILNLYAVRLGLELPGLVCVNDSLLYRLLWQHGALAPGPMIAAIQTQQFELIIFPPNGLVESTPGPYEEILANIRKHYTLATAGRAQYWVPLRHTQTN